MKSGIYAGRVRHRRFSPKTHNFEYPVYMLAIDLDEIDLLENSSSLFSFSRRTLLQVRRNDYLAQDNNTLKNAVVNELKNLGCNTQFDRIVMVCQARCLGLYFSPVNFYFCYEDDVATTMLAEVSNTPWGEKHCYLVPINEQGFKHEKVFHVSPFMDLNMQYKWHVKEPTEHLSVHIENWREDKLFDATMTLTRSEWNHNNLKKTLWQWPAMTFSIMKGIYWQALKLFIKAIPFVPHPGR